MNTTESRGTPSIADVLLLDQSSIGRTSRSNPASYVGALDVLRKRFASAPLARERGYTAGTFSFNSGNGRCPTCGGNGFEHLEMQFLADVYLRCPDCHGRRYRAEVLEVGISGSVEDAPTRSIADVLEMTATEALAFFADDKDLRRALEPLQSVGLGYLRLGQPVPTLSGGEAQRLKLAGYLAKSRRRRAGDGGFLFLLDEPTTGLHFADIAVLLDAFRHLIRQGHSLLVIEHNLDVIAAADWLIDLGPEGGEQGGEIVCCGTPEQVAEHPTSQTGRALKKHLRAVVTETPAPAYAIQHPDPPPIPVTRSPPDARHSIAIRHAREHNLKDLTLSIPRDQLTVITGVSGSGKSTLAFDILFAEGQRRYLESLNAYARQFVQPAARADVDAVHGIPPTIAIEQRTSRGGAKSTVGTLTEIHHSLRLLYVKLGIQDCPDCAIPIEPMTRDAILARLLRDHAGQRISLMAPMVIARKGLYNELAAWAAGKGWPILRVDGAPVATDDWPRLDRFREHSIDLPLGEFEVDPSAEPDLACLARSGAGSGQGAGSRGPPRARRLGRGNPLLHRARLSRLRARLSRARPASLQLQLQARLVPRLFRDRPGADRLRRRAERRGRPMAGGDGQPRACLPRLPGRPTQSSGAGRALSRAFHRRPLGPHGRPDRRRAGRAATEPARDRHRPRSPERGSPPARLSLRGRAWLSGARPRRAHALGRRGAAPPARGPARLQSARRLLCAGRAHHRAASARSPTAARDPGPTPGQGQHGRGGRARRGDDPARRSCHRSGTGRRGAGRRDHRARHRHRADGQPEFSDRPLSRASS